jgi:cytochrome c553
MSGPLRALLVVAALAPTAARAQDAAAVEFFEKKVRPVLAEHCLTCHGADPASGGRKSPGGGLMLTSRADLLAGGDSGPAVAPGDPAKSRLIQTVRHDGELKMPPKGKLSDAQVTDLTKWVKDGAAWPAAGAAAPAPKAGGPLFTAEQKAFWAFQPVKAPPVPAGQNPIDHFVRKELADAGLNPSPPADRRTLLRRATFDLTGLPPTPAEIDAFLADTSADAWEKVVDRLLASPAYGERWGRHWLDLARYADSNGLDENTAFANAWRYRDYVVRAFNADKPFDRFVKEQLAGDLLPDGGADGVVATGFLVLGPKLLAEPDKQKMLLDVADEQLDVVGKAFLGLTVSCARCHDHKFDPIPARDYYSLLGVFTSTRTMQGLGTVAKAFERPLPGTAPEDAAKLREVEKKLVAKTREVRLARDKVKAEPDPEKKKPLQDAVAALQKEVDDLRAAAPAAESALAVEEGTAAAYATAPRNLYVQVRGNYTTPGEQAPAVFPRILAGEEQTEFVPTRVNPADTAEPNKTRFGRVRERSGRLELANWIASADNPLTARVIVNRVWQHHFGEGIVRTPDNFGRLGDRPTHPELLDWLAARFVADGWSLKKLHKRILLSETYRRSAAHDPKAAFADPDNRLLWRFNRRRLEAEAIRDAMLAVAGTLDRTAGGSLLNNGNFEYVSNDRPKVAARYDTTRRSVYLPVVRNNVYDFFQAFDFAEPHVPAGKRAATVVAPQALFMLNNPFVGAQAAAFAEALLALPGADADRVRAAYPRAFGREATADEVARALAFLAEYEASLGDAAGRRAKAWAAWCRVLFASSEFVTVG